MMAESISVADVRELVETSLPDAVISGLITFIDGADTCLDANGVSADQQRNLKLFGVAHLVEMQTNGGAGVKSMSGPLGDSITYSDKGSDSESTYYGQTLQTIDEFGCVTSLLVNRVKVSTFVVDGIVT